MRRPRDKGKKAASRVASPPQPRGQDRTRHMSKSFKSNGNRNRNGKMVIKAELVSNPVEEWTEFRVYMGKKVVGSFGTEDKAKAFVKRAA